MSHDPSYLPDCLRPTELHDFGDVPFERPSLTRAALVAIALVAMVVGIHQFASRVGVPTAVITAQQAPADDLSPPLHIRLD